MEMTHGQLAKMLEHAAEVSAMVVLTKTGKMKAWLNMSEAYKAYGRTSVDRWIKEGLVTPYKDGNASSTFRIDRVQIESVYKTSNRQTYQSVLERRSGK